MILQIYEKMSKTNLYCHFLRNSRLSLKRQ